MCLIISKPKGTTISKKTLTKAWNSNHDGAGLAYWDNGHIVIEKGIMTLDGLISAIDRLQKKQLVIHLRFATHGIVNELQTHPYILADTIDTVKLGNYVKGCIFHNGILHGFGSSEISDTLDFTLNVLNKVRNTDNKIKLLETIGSKWALLVDNETYLIGDFTDYKGLKVSNTYFDMYYGYDNYGFKKTYDFSDYDALCQDCYSNKATTNMQGFKLCDDCYNHYKKGGIYDIE